MKNIIFFLFALFSTVHTLQSQDAKFVSQKISNARKYLQNDAKLGLKATSDRFLYIQKLEKEVREGKAERVELLNELVEWRTQCAKLEDVRYKLGQELASITKEAQKLRQENKISEEKYNDLMYNHNILKKEKDELDHDYLGLQKRYKALESENADLKLQITFLKQELSTAAKQSFINNGVNIDFIFKNKRLKNPGWSTDKVIPRKKYDSIEVNIKFSISKNADIQIKKPYANVRFNYRGRAGKFSNQKIPLIAKEEKGFLVFTGTRTYNEHDIIKNLDNIISVSIIGWEDVFFVEKTIKFED